MTRYFCTHSMITFTERITLYFRPEKCVFTGQREREKHCAFRNTEHDQAQALTCLEFLTWECECLCGQERELSKNDHKWTFSYANYYVHIRIIWIWRNQLQTKRHRIKTNRAHQLCIYLTIVQLVWLYNEINVERKKKQCNQI